MQAVFTANHMLLHQTVMTENYEAAVAKRT